MQCCADCAALTCATLVSLLLNGTGTHALLLGESLFAGCDWISFSLRRPFRCCTSSLAATARQHYLLASGLLGTRHSSTRHTLGSVFCSVLCCAAAATSTGLARTIDQLQSVRTMFTTPSSDSPGCKQSPFVPPLPRVHLFTPNDCSQTDSLPTTQADCHFGLRTVCFTLIH